MRTEVKIGIFIALIVAGVVVVFLIDQANKGGAVSQTLPFDRSEVEPPPGDEGPEIARDGRPTDDGQPTQPQPVPRLPRDDDRDQTPPDITPREDVGFMPPVERDPIFTPLEPDRELDPNDALEPAPAGVDRPTRAPLTTQPVREPDAVTETDTEPTPPAEREPEPEPREANRPPEETTGRVLPPTRDQEDSPTRRDTDRRLPPREGPRRHQIVEGDSLWSLAEDYYGDGTLWKQIAAANPGMDPDRIKVGQTLVIPPKEAAAEPSPAPTATTSDEVEIRKHEYVVERGDTLSSIARNILQDVSKWRLIYELNQDRIENPDVLTPGLVLRLPKE